MTEHNQTSNTALNSINKENGICSNNSALDINQHEVTISCDIETDKTETLLKYFGNESNRNKFLSTVFGILGFQLVTVAAILVAVHDLHILDKYQTVEFRWLTAGIGVSSLALLALMFFYLERMKKVNFKSVHLGHFVLGLCTFGGAFVASALEVISNRHYDVIAILIPGLSFISVSLFYRQSQLEKSVINLGMLIISTNTGFASVFYLICDYYDGTLLIFIAPGIGMVLTSYIQILCNEIIFPKGCLSPTFPSNDTLLAVVYVYMGIVFVGFVFYSFLMCLFGCPSKFSCCFCAENQPPSHPNNV